MIFDELQILLEKLFVSSVAVQAVFSMPTEKRAEVLKVTLRPIFMQNRLNYQSTKHYARKTEHENYALEDVKTFIVSLLESQFKQATLFTEEADYHLLVSAKKKLTIIKKKPTKKLAILPHNRPKQMLLPEGDPVPFLVDLGIMNAQGKVVAAKSNKFRQINRFLEIIADVLDAWDGSAPINIVDFGCGKAYLTFALYHFLVNQRKLPVRIHGLDLKADVVAHCASIAERLGYSELTFEVGDIAGYQANDSIDMVVALHACDTATDAALAQAVRWQAKVILAVPCCQHELFQQIENDDLAPLLRHGILKERFAALATDAARANLLEMQGYKTQVMEFIDMEHTPKNLLIRAVKKGSPDPSRGKEYLRLKEMLGFDITLEKLLG